MSKKIVKDDIIYCYKCGTKNDKHNKKCCNKECRAKLQDKDHVYIDYFIEKWHEYLEDLGKDSVVGALSLFFNYILYGTILTISVIGIASGIIDAIVDKATDDKVAIIDEYNNKYDSDSLIKGCWYNDLYDDYWVIANEQLRIQNGKKSKVDFSFSKNDHKRFLTITLDDGMIKHKYEWKDLDSFIFYNNSEETIPVLYKRIKCSEVPGEKIEEPVIDVKPEITTASKTTTKKTTTVRSTLNTSHTTKYVPVIYQKRYNTLDECDSIEGLFDQSEIAKKICVERHGFDNAINSFKFNVVGDVCKAAYDKDGKLFYYINITDASCEEKIE